MQQVRRSEIVPSPLGRSTEHFYQSRLIILRGLKGKVLLQSSLKCNFDDCSGIAREETYP